MVWVVRTGHGVGRGCDRNHGSGGEQEQLHSVFAATTMFVHVLLHFYDELLCPLCSGRSGSCGAVAPLTKNSYWSPPVLTLPGLVTSRFDTTREEDYWTAWGRAAIVLHTLHDTFDSKHL